MICEETVSSWVVVQNAAVAPPGQQAVVSLSNQNFAAFQQAFDADTGAPRLVLLLSPT